MKRWNSVSQLGALPADLEAKIKQAEIKYANHIESKEDTTERSYLYSVQLSSASNRTLIIKKHRQSKITRSISWKN